MKNVEKRCAKEKGITPMAIKDILQELVDDGLVHGEKIGTSNYYWAFPSEGANIVRVPGLPVVCLSVCVFFGMMTTSPHACLGVWIAASNEEGRSRDKNRGVEKEKG